MLSEQFRSAVQTALNQREAWTRRQQTPWSIMRLITASIILTLQISTPRVMLKSCLAMQSATNVGIWLLSERQGYNFPIILFMLVLTHSIYYIQMYKQSKYMRPI